MLKNIGKWKISSVNMGKFKLDGGAMMGTVPKVMWEKTNPPDDLNRIDLALRCLLVDDGENVVLIETGLGDKVSDKFKNIFQIKHIDDTQQHALSRTGYSCSDITHVILTHLHFDHSGGATRFDDQGHIIPTFPNAKYYISEKNWRAGFHPNPRDRASYLIENYEALEKYGVLTLLPGNSQILPGISTYLVNGHTSGQQLVKVEDAGETVVFISDLIPLRSHLQIPWIMGYDLNAMLTLEEKIKFLEQASDGKWWLWFYHDPKTVSVRVNKGEKHYEVTEEIKEIDNK